MSLPYKQAPFPAYWGTANSVSNFCEEDYIISTYICEFINTLTNSIYVIYAIYGLRANSGKPDAFQRNLPYFGIAAVGVGSAIFHATMKNYTQWGDDLSMLLATGTVLHRVYTFDKSLNYTITFGLGLTTILTAFAIWHCVTDETIMHSIIFGLMIHIIAQKTRVVIKDRIHVPAIQKEVRKVAIWGATTFATGFAIWCIDNAICNQLTELKRAMGMPWSFLLEFHGWWHILTGIGAYIFIALVEYLTSDEADQPLEGRFAWPVDWIIDGSAGTGNISETVVDGKKNI